MPLLKNKSQAAFNHNLRAELAAGKPKNQALAIAYSVQRRSKAEGGGISPYSILEAVSSGIRNSNPFTSFLGGAAKSIYNHAGVAAKEATDSYFGALNNDYKPSNAVSMLDSGEYIDKEGKIIPEQYRPNVLPVTKTEPGKGLFGSRYEVAMPAMLDVWNTVGNPFAPAKGVTLGSGFVRKAAKAADEIDLERLLEETKDFKSRKPVELGPEPITAEEIARQQRAKDQGYTDWYHGTTHNIPESGFSMERGNIENYLGKYPHFTSAPHDASVNYAGMGPDLKSRIDIHAERIEDILQHEPETYGYERGNDSIADLRKKAFSIAKEELAGPHEGAVIPAALRMKNPVRVTPEKPSWLDLSYTDYGEDGLHPSNTLQKLESSLKELGEQYHFDGQQVLGELHGQGLIGDEVRADKFYKGLRDALEGFAEDDEGNRAVGHVASELFHRMGYDGIIMDASKAFPRMDMPPGTKHAAIFDLGNVRSKFAKFDPEKVGQEGLLLGRGSAPMPRSPYDREDRKDQRRGGRINKAGGGSLFGGGGGSGWGGDGGYDSAVYGLLQKYFGDPQQSGLSDRPSEDLKLSMPGDYKIGPNDAQAMGLSLPQGGGNAAWDNNRQSPFMGPLKKGAMRNREDRAGGIASLEDVIGTDRPVYPENSPYSKFSGSVGNDATIEMVGAPKKKWLHKDDEQPPVRFTPMSGTALGDPAPFNRKFVPQDTSRFNKKLGSGADDAENITPDSIYNPDKSNAYWTDLPLKEKVRDIVKSYGTGFANGVPDVVGLPRTLASIAGPAVPDMLLNTLPKSEDWKNRIDTALYGKGGEAYTPRTGAGRFANSAGEVSPYIAAATALAATRGGLTAPAVAGGLAGVLGGALRHGKEAFRNNSPLAYNPMYSNAFADGGSIPFAAREGAKALSKAGLVNSASAGRADKVPGAVKAGAYVMPADVVSAMGQGNTMAGARALNSLMGMSPYGANAARAPKGRGMTAQRMKRFADGGGTDQDVPVNVSGGEFIFPPEAVEAIGGGDIDHGHEILDALAMQVRQKNISHLTKLPPPRKD